MFDRLDPIRPPDTETWVKTKEFYSDRVPRERREDDFRSVSINRLQGAGTCPRAVVVADENLSGSAACIGRPTLG